MNQIQVLMAPGEAHRQKGMEDAIKGDKRFGTLEVKAGLPVDLKFAIVEWSEEYPPEGGKRIRDFVDKKALYIELKEPQDFVQSVLDGHLCNQTLTIREGMLDGCAVILGDLDSIQAAIKKSAQGRGLRGDDIRHAIATTYARCKSFRKRSFLNGIPTFWQGDDSGFMDDENMFINIKELAHDFLQDGSMIGFGTRPAEGERELGACNHWMAGMGPATLKEVLKHYKLALVPRGQYAKPVEEIKGVGAKRAKDLNSRIVMFYES